MTDAAVFFAWWFGLSDWRTAKALGVTEGAVRDHRRRMGLKKTGAGQPVRFASGTEVPTGGTIGSGRSPARERPRKTRLGEHMIGDFSTPRKRDANPCALRMAQDAGRAGV